MSNPFESGKVLALEFYFKGHTRPDYEAAANLGNLSDA